MAEQKTAESRMQKAVDRLVTDYSEIRAGRANPNVLDKVMVDYYGTPTPINQVGSVSVAEARILVIQPWDTQLLKDIQKSIQTSDLGINPQNDGKSIRLVFPQPTEERRKEMTKQVSRLSEEGKVAVRNVRRDAMDKIKSMKKNGEMTEDEQRVSEKEVQELADKYVKNLDVMAAEKSKEIMSV